MKFNIEQEGSVHLLIPEGELVGGEGNDRLKRELDRLHQEGKTRIVIDFSKVSYIDSSALGHLMHGYSIFKKAGGDLRLLRPSRRILDLLSITGLIQVFEIYQNRQEAMDSWGRGE